MSAQSNGKGLWIPEDLMSQVTEGRISLVEAGLLSLITSLSKTDEGCYASNAYLAKRLGLSSRQVQRLMARLEELRLIKTKYGRSRKINPREG